MKVARTDANLRSAWELFPVASRTFLTSTGFTIPSNSEATLAGQHESEARNALSRADGRCPKSWTILRILPTLSAMGSP